MFLPMNRALSMESEIPVTMEIDEKITEDSKDYASLSELPYEIKLQIVRDYLLSHDLPEKAKIKSTFDIDKFIKSTSLAGISRNFRDLILDPELRFLLINQFVEEHPQQAIDDLVQSAFEADVEMVQDLIKANVNVNGIGIHSHSMFARTYKSTPLERAVSFDEDTEEPFVEMDDKPNVKIIKALLEAGASADLRSDSNPIYPTPLLTILNNSDLFDETRDKIVLMLLKAGANPNITGYDPEAPALYYAITGEYNACNIIKYLLDSGANPFTDEPYFPNIGFDTTEETLIARIQNSNDGIKKIITNHPYDKLLLNSVMSKDVLTLYPLLNQAQFKLPNFNINAQDDKGYTALMLAVNNNFIIIASLLLWYKADPNIAANNGETALSIAQDKNATTNKQFRDKAEMIDLLKEYGAQ